MGTTATAMNISSFAKQMSELPEEEKKMPLLFVGHGSPMNIVMDNPFTRAMEKIGKELPRPKVILSISAHWLTRGTFVCGVEKPKTIYDFYGFPDELYKMNYPSAGSPQYAKEVQQIIKKTEVKLDNEWGLDHGTWSVLKHMYPNADVPVFQMSIDYYKPASYHYELAKELSSLRKKGVLIIGSGNIVHNLRIFDWDVDAKISDWALEFDEKVKNNLLNKNHNDLMNYQNLGNAAQLAVPTNDHYLPLMYVIAMQEKNELLTFPFEGFQHGTVSMRCVKVGS